MIAMPGAWKNFAELEENLTLPELTLLLETHQDWVKREHVFDASLQGIDMMKAEHEEKIREVKRRAQQKIYGERSFEEMELGDLGFSVESF